MTEVEPVGDFWQAEPEHQDYLERYPNRLQLPLSPTNWVLPGGRRPNDRLAYFRTRILLHRRDVVARLDRSDRSSEVARVDAAALRATRHGALS